MTERLTDEQLRAWRDRRDPNLRTPTPPHSESVVPLIDDILALRARVAKLEAALKEAQISETSWREMAEYWETLCKAVMPQ